MKIGNLETYGIIYKIKNKVNNKIYIGQTTNKNGFNGRYPYKGKNIERVYKYHNFRKNKNLDYNTYLLRSIEKYGFDTFEVCKIFDTAFSKNELDIKEQIWIQFYNSFNNGYNFTKGGDGVTGLKGKLNPNKKEIVQLNLKGEYIKIWNCIANASSFLHINQSGIVSCCKNNQKSAGKYMWMYLKDYNANKNNILPYKKETKSIPIVQLTLEGTFIKEYNSCKEASEQIHISSTLISECCKNKKKRKSASNFMWLHKEDYIKLNKKINPINREESGKTKIQIVQLDLENNFIRVFNSISFAANQISKASSSHITSCCTGNRKNSGGFKWMYYKDYLNNKIPLINEKIKLICVNTGEKFKSIIDIKNKYHIDNSQIIKCCKRKRKSAGKHPITGEKLQWMYYEDYIKQSNNENIHKAS